MPHTDWEQPQEPAVWHAGSPRPPAIRLLLLLVSAGASSRCEARWDRAVKHILIVAHFVVHQVDVALQLAHVRLQGLEAVAHQHEPVPFVSRAATHQVGVPLELGDRLSSTRAGRR